MIIKEVDKEAGLDLSQYTVRYFTYFYMAICHYKQEGMQDVEKKCSRRSSLNVNYRPEKGL